MADGAGVSLRLSSDRITSVQLDSVELQARVAGSQGSCVFVWPGCVGLAVGRDGILIDASFGMSMTIVA